MPLIPHRRRLRFEPLEDRRVLAAYIVDTELDVVDVGDNLTSLREAIAVANENPGADEITFDFGHDGPAKILLEHGQLEITDGLTISGDGPELLTIDAQQQSRVLIFSESTGDLSLSRLTLTGGRTTGDNVFSEGLDSTEFSGGGLRFMSEGTLSLISSRIVGNWTTGDDADGGGIFLLDGKLYVADSVVSDNAAHGRRSRGGGILAFGGDVEIHDSTVSNSNGAGIVTSSGDITLIGSVVHNNIRGGMRTEFGDVTLLDSIVSSNRGSAGGGGISARTGDVSLTRSSVINNSYTIGSAGGGGIYLETGSLVLSDSEVSGNQTLGSSSSGGGIASGSRSSPASSGTITLINSSVTENLTLGPASDGGGIYSKSRDVIVIGSTISKNGATGSSGDGGGIFAVQGDVIIENSTVSGNRAGGLAGGGIYAEAGKVSLVRSTVSDNIADSIGGGIASGGFGVVLAQSTITNNRAAFTGGVSTAGANPTVELSGSILSGNAGEDLSLSSTENVASLGHNLIGSSNELAFLAEDTTNIVSTNPRLGPLADNGGPTKTHSLLPGSPALDAGDPSIAFDPGEFDQRGAGFARVVDGGNGLRIDIGAYELQGAPIGFPDGDYNHDGIAGASDYAVWRETLGETVTPGEGADGVTDGVIDSLDFDFWQDNYGNTTVPLAPSSTPLALAARTMAFAGFALAGEAQEDATISRFSRSLATDANSLQDDLLLLAQDQTGSPGQREALASDSREAIDEDSHGASKDESATHESATLAAALGRLG